MILKQAYNPDEARTARKPVPKFGWRGEPEPDESIIWNGPDTNLKAEGQLISRQDYPDLYDAMMAFASVGVVIELPVGIGEFIPRSAWYD